MTDERPAARKRYMFIRLLEACNADCFMCEFAKSRDRFRFSVEEFAQIIPQARTVGVEYIRFTGGEPLLHRNIESLIGMGASADMKMSLITNGALLPRMAQSLASAGLSQVIVSLDAASASTHDTLRNTDGLFEACTNGIEIALGLGLQVRVNTVVGPSNFGEVPQLQKLLTALGVHQWELSALKLDRPIHYSSPENVLSVCEPVYAADSNSLLVPTGKRFYGESIDQQRMFFQWGITPRPSGPHCHLVSDVIYIDAKARRLFGCNLLPHRMDVSVAQGVRMCKGDPWNFDLPEFASHVAHFRKNGPVGCTGCSPMAAEYSDRVSMSSEMHDWDF